MSRKEVLEQSQERRTEREKERGGKGERNRDRVNQMRSERNQNPPTGNRAKLLFSLYGKNSPKSHRIALGVESKSC